MQHRSYPTAQSISATELANVSPCELKVVFKQRYRTSTGKSMAAQRGDREHIRFDARARLAGRPLT